MKFIINESQYKRLLSEQKVYTSKSEYDKALNLYNNQMYIYNLSNEICYATKMLTKLYERVNEKKTVTNDIIKEYWKFHNVVAKYGVLNSGIRKMGNKLNKISDRICRIDKVSTEASTLMTSHTAAILGGTYICPLFEKPVKPIYKKPETIKKSDNVKSAENVINGLPNIEPPIESPIPKSAEPIKTNFSATFGQDGKQETIYFNNFDEWKRFDDSVRGKFGYINSTFNQSETEASVLLKGTPSDWGL